MLNRRGGTGERTMIFSFLFLLIIVGGGIVAGVYVFYGNEYDFREQEAGMLAYKIKECFVSGRGDFDFKTEDEFFLACGLNKEVVSKNIIVKLCEDKKERNCEDATPGIFQVGSNFVVCKIKGVDKFPQCKVLKFSKDKKNFELIVGSKQFSKGVVE